MKKTLLIMSLFTAMILTACGSESAPTDDSADIEVESQEANMQDVKEENDLTNENNVEDTEGTLSADELKEMIEYNALGENDELINISFENDEIKAIIDVGPHDFLPENDIASTIYSQASDELLQHEGWEILTVEFIDVGTISMNRSDKESNEYGDYFPMGKIYEILDVELLDIEH